ncbi:hypothetical protein LINGRAHAP2_LOCUS8127, partial [Linum grandiflorum]
IAVFNLESELAVVRPDGLLGGGGLLRSVGALIHSSSSFGDYWFHEHYQDPQFDLSLPDDLDFLDNGVDFLLFSDKGKCSLSLLFPGLTRSHLVRFDSLVADFGRCGCAEEGRSVGSEAEMGSEIDYINEVEERPS